MALLSKTIPSDGEQRLVTCLACGGVVEPVLAAAGSLRCLDCRDVSAELNRHLVTDREDRSFGSKV
jgi:hypothetical protein